MSSNTDPHQVFGMSRVSSKPDCEIFRSFSLFKICSVFFFPDDRFTWNFKAKQLKMWPKQRKK